MPRIRTIKPEFFDSPDTARASHRARLLFIAMWCWADDYGVGTANDKALAGFAFPNDDDITASELPCIRKEVADAFGVVFYKVRGRSYYAIPSWDKHQRTERKAKRVNPPSPDSITAGQTMCEGPSDDTQGASDAMHGSSGVGTGEQGNRGTKNTSNKLDARFPEFYEPYPRHEGRGQAVKAWRAACKKADPDEILAGLRKQLPVLTETERRFVPLPATWLNGERWADELKPTGTSGRNPNIPEGW